MKYLKKLATFGKKFYNTTSPLELAQQHFSQGNFKLSLEILQKEILKTTDNFEKSTIHNNLGIIYENMNEFDKAVKEYHSSILLNPTESSTYCNLGVIFHRLKQVENAQKMYMKAMEIDPDFVECRYRLAQIYIENSNVKEADYHFNECIRTDPDFEPAYEQLIILHKEDDLGLEYAEKLIKKEKFGSTKGLHYKAYILHTKKEYVDALEVYEEIIEHEPNNAKAYMSAAILYDQLKQIDNALILIHKAFELDPKSTDILQVLANLLHKKGRNNESIHLFQEILKKNPKSDVILYNYGKVLIKLGKRKEAIALVADVLEKNPQLKTLHVILEEFKTTNPDNLREDIINEDEEKTKV